MENLIRASFIHTIEKGFHGRKMIILKRISREKGLVANISFFNMPGRIKCQFLASATSELKKTKVSLFSSLAVN